MIACRIELISDAREVYGGDGACGLAGGECDTTLMGVDNAFDDGQAQSIARRFGEEKGLGQTDENIRRDGISAILHCEAGLMG